MANDYCSIDEFSQIVKLDPEKYGTLLQFMLDTAAQHINNVCKRKKDGFLADSVATARLFSGNDSHVIQIDENVNISAVGFKYSSSDASYTVMAATDYTPFSGSNDSPDYNNTPYTKLLIHPEGDYSYWPKTKNFPNIQVTAKWGYSLTVPDVIKHCTIIQATRYVKRAQGAYGDAIGNTDTGQMQFVKQFDADMKAMLFAGGMIRVSNGIGSKY